MWVRKVDGMLVNLDTGVVIYSYGDKVRREKGLGPGVAIGRIDSDAEDDPDLCECGTRAEAEEIREGLARRLGAVPIEEIQRAADPKV